MIDLIRLSLWGKGSASPDQSVFDAMKRHTIAALPAEVLSAVSLPPDLRSAWTATVYQTVSGYVNYQLAQDALPLTVPYVVLKGTSAAQYYPHPEYRSMGDIDVMTRREDFDTAYRQLLDGGYHIVKQLDRETSFVKNGFEVELHTYFASLNDPAMAQYLDDLIIAHINPSHVLPDDINGLVLLEHISQHLENGLGLRQIIDWMLFVDKCLPDEKWPAFAAMAKNIGLEKLALVTTRMCEIYLGLPERSWCAAVEEAPCKAFLDYVLSCGNFGNKWTQDSRVSTDVFAYSRSPAAFFRVLQARGLENWEAARKRPALRPFAWLYQAFKYLGQGLGRERGFARAGEDFQVSLKRIRLLNALGVKQKQKGLVVFRDGKYVKE